MKKPFSLCLALLALLAFFSCGSTGSSSPDLVFGVDALVRESARRTADLLLRMDKEPATMAVYYFTAEGKRSPMSDYLIEGLTTEVANLLLDLDLKTKMVTRSRLDAALAELSFQLSDLADETSGLKVGKQLGAEVILSGTISKVGLTYKLNAQLVYVQTGEVIGGFIINFVMDSGMADAAPSALPSAAPSPAATAPSETSLAPGRREAIAGASTKTVIMEDYTRTTASVAFASFEHGYGEAGEKAKLSGRIDYAATGGPGDTGRMAYAFSGEVPATPLGADWSGSGASFALDGKMPALPPEAKGIALSLRPEGFAKLEIALIQGADARDYRVFLFLDEGRWQELRIPFSRFAAPPGRPAFDPAQPFTLHVDIDYGSNFELFSFRGPSFGGKLGAGNIGYFSYKSDPSAAVVESWNDELTRFAFTVISAGLDTWMEYPADGGEAVARKVPGVESAEFARSLVDRDGGKALEVSLAVEAGPEFYAFVAEHPDYSISLQVLGAASLKLKGKGGITGVFRQEGLGELSFAVGRRLPDGEEAWSYSNPVAGSIWTMTGMAFSSFEDFTAFDEDSALVAIGGYAGAREIARAKGPDGKFRIVLGIDDILVE